MATKEQVVKAEQQIYSLRKNVRYDIRELTVQIIVNKYEKGLDYQVDDEFLDKSKFYNVLFIPDYQRDFTWDKVRQSRFIESILLGLPIPLVFVAENKDGAWEIVDGSQRIRTLNAFLNNRLTLNSLEKIDTLNGFQFQDLDVSRQGKFMDTPLRMIVLSEDADDEVKRDMFERINRGSDLLKPMEKRKGDKTGKFTDFIYDICINPDKVEKKYQEVNTLLRELAPIDMWLENRQEREELVLRYFALSDSDKYKHFPKDTGIAKFLDDYLGTKNSQLSKLNDDELNAALKKYLDDFLAVLKFVKQYSIYGFRRTHNPQTKRVIFESLSVGVHVALKQKPNLVITTEKMMNILNSKNFRKYWQGNTKVHEPSKVKERVEFITNQLLGK
jgi:hypothetical protein